MSLTRIYAKQSILVVEDDGSSSFGYKTHLAVCGYEVITAGTLEGASEAMEAKKIHAVLLDLKMSDDEAMHWIPRLKRMHPEIPIVLITGTGGEPSAFEATKNGVDNVLAKPVDMLALEIFLAKCFQPEVPGKPEIMEPEVSKNVGPIFGEGKSIAKVLKYVGLAATHQSVVLLLGETGTGKGVIANWIHENSDCKSAPFIALNCSSLKGELMQSELFGHAKGAFTSAVKDRAGLIEMADGGTLFLDEIGDMDLSAQAQLLKTIEDKSFRRVGESKLRKSNFRLICATNHDLAQESRENKFRADLFYRINVFPITVPPLRERTEDLKDLAYYFLKMFNYRQFPLSDEIMELLKSYSWPGNVRELRNVLERAWLLAQGQPLLASHFPDLLDSPAVENVDMEIDNLELMENLHILKTMKKYNGDKRKSSEALGMSFSNLYRRLSKIDEPQLHISL